MSHPRKLVHTSRIPIRWGDMDALEHVNNTVYFQYMEQARIEWLYVFAATHRPAQGDEGTVVVNASCTFHQALTYPGEVEVRMYLGEPGRTSVGSHYEMWMNDKKYAEGAAKIVWMNLKTMRPALLPEPLKALLQHP